jgi:hypothetical protein
MKSMRFGVLSCVAAALVFAGACSEDDRPNPAGRGAGGTHSGAAGKLNKAGAGAGGTLNGRGGTASVNGGAPDPGVGGAPETGGTLGMNLAGAAGSETAPILEQLAFCPRLSGAYDRAREVTLAYRLAVYGDCRVRWVVLVPFSERFLEKLQAFNMRLWGCNPPPLSEFGLVPTTPITAGDSRILISIYLAESSRLLALSQTEINDMQLALELLASLAIEGDTLEPSRPECDEGGGGAGGNEAGGAPSSAGAGGAPGGFGGDNTLGVAGAAL